MQSKFTTCAMCGALFIPSKTNVLKGYGRCCSRPCGRAHQQANQIASRPDRFWAKVQKTDGCWLWTAARDPHGYGIFINGTAYRYSYELHYGPIPDGLCVCHRCDNPPCVRPDHLFLGTQRENIADMNAKDRGARGDMLPQTRLTEQDVRKIRAEHATGKYSHRDLAEMHGVSHATIQAVIYRITWKHVR